MTGEHQTTAGANDFSIVPNADALAQPAARQRQRGYNEVALRDAIEAWGRSRWPDARVCHELVLGQGHSRLDVAFVRPAELVLFELKSAYDVMERAIHQAAMALLCGHQAWLVTDRRHREDTKAVAYLLPRLGLIEAEFLHSGTAAPFEGLSVIREAVPGEPYPEAIANVLWAAEQAAALRIGGKPPRRSGMTQALARLAPAERAALVCWQLRGRDALWRADPPLTEPEPLKVAA